MKKFLPLVLLLVGLLVFGGVFYFVKGRSGDTQETDVEEVAPEISLEDRPVTSLTPSDDGHWLKLLVEKIVIDAETMDYELLYKLPDDRTQGVPGTIKLIGQDSIERDLLLGSESSGKFRYDEGVEQGTLTLRFRNNKGKLIAKFSTEFSLIEASEEKYSSVDEKFSYKVLDKRMMNGYIVVMETFGLPEMYSGDIVGGPYGVFASDRGASGTVEFDLNVGCFGYIDGEWVDVGNESSSDFGIFVAVGE